MDISINWKYTLEMHLRQANLLSSSQILGHVADQNYIAFIDSPYENWSESKSENTRHEKPSRRDARCPPKIRLLCLITHLVSPCLYLPIVLPSGLLIHCPCLQLPTNIRENCVYNQAHKAEVDLGFPRGGHKPQRGAPTY